MKPRPKFKAVFNPITRDLLVKYGDAITKITFQDLDEWGVVNFDADEKHPCYLHIQLDYDEMAQLLFYPRVEGDEGLNEGLGTYWNSFGKKKPTRIKIVYNDFAWNVALKDFLEATDSEYDWFRESGYMSLEGCRKLLETGTMDLRII